MNIRCIVACQGRDGADLFPCWVAVTDEGYDVGDHYDHATELAHDEGYDGPYVVFDENDGPEWLFDNLFKERL